MVLPEVGKDEVQPKPRIWPRHLLGFARGCAVIRPRMHEDAHPVGVQPFHPWPIHHRAHPAADGGAMHERHVRNIKLVLDRARVVGAPGVTDGAIAEAIIDVVKESGRRDLTFGLPPPDEDEPVRLVRGIGLDLECLRRPARSGRSRGSACSGRWCRIQSHETGT